MVVHDRRVVSERGLADLQVSPRGQLAVILCTYALAASGTSAEGENGGVAEDECGDDEADPEEGELGVELRASVLEHVPEGL